MPSIIWCLLRGSKCINSLKAYEDHWMCILLKWWQINQFFRSLWGGWVYILYSLINEHSSWMWSMSFPSCKELMVFEFMNCLWETFLPFFFLFIFLSIWNDDNFYILIKLKICYLRDWSLIHTGRKEEE